MLLDYTQLTLYGMYVILIILSFLGAFLHIYSANVAEYVLLVVVGHFMGVLTPSPPTVKSVVVKEGSET